MTSRAWPSSRCERGLGEPVRSGRCAVQPRPATAPRRRRCCRCRETSVWSSSARLTPVPRAFIRGDDRGARRTPASSGSRAMWAIGSGMPSVVELARGASAAEGALVDEPQLGPSVREPEPGVQVLLVRGVRRLRRAAGRSCPGASAEPGRARPALEDQPEVLAAATGRGRPSTRRAGRRGRRLRAGGGARTRAPWNSADAIRAPDDVGVEAAPDDLDLGQLRHTGPRRDRASHWSVRRVTSGSRAGLGAAALVERGPGLLGGLLLGLLLAPAGAVAAGPRRRRPRWPRTPSRGRVRTRRRGTRARRGRPGGQLLQARLPVQAGAERTPPGVDQRVEEVVDERARRGRCPPAR